MKRYVNLILVIAIGIQIVVFSGCNSRRKKSELNAEGDYLQGNISISGAFALYPITVRWAEEFQKMHPEVKIDISAGGAGKGMADALSQMVDLGMFSRQVSDQEKEKGAWWIAITKDAVLPTINAKNNYIHDIKYKGISRENFIKIFITQEITEWGELLGNDNNDRINVYTRSDACGAAAMWGQYLGKNQEDLYGVGVFGDPGMADAIRSDIYGIGYNNVVYIYDIKTRNKYPGLDVVPVDLDGNGVITKSESFYYNLDTVIQAIRIGIYPSPPARDLYYVSKGKPEKLVVKEFIQWVLTEGQQYVKEAGYVRLTEEKINNELLKVQ